jgi:carboxymethylenebutenolidase
MAALSSAPQERLLADLRAGLSELERRASGHRLGAVGFCFGGGMVWLLLASGEPRLAAAALQRAELTHEIVTYPGANHAFFNDTGPRYNPDAATQAYAKLLDWFGRHLR